MADHDYCKLEQIYDVTNMDQLLDLVGTVPVNNNNVLPSCDAPPKEFNCHFCPEKYRSFGALQRHLKFECHVALTFKCPIECCKYKARMATGLLKHISAMHPYYDIQQFQQIFS